MLHSSLLAQIDAVAREGSIRGAAERLHVAASSINRRLIALEEELGLALFHRRPSGMELTAAGEVVIAHIRQTLREADRMQARLDEMKGLKGARVRVSAMQGLAQGLLPRILIAFQARHPKVSVTVRARVVADVEADLASGEADLGLLYGLPGSGPPLLGRRFPTRLGAVVAPVHPLAERRDIRLSDLTSFPVVIANESITIHALIADAYARAGLPLAPRTTTNSVGLLKYMARHGEAVTFLSRIDVDEELREGTLRWIPILGQELRSHELRLAHRRGGTLAPAVAILEEHLTRSLAEIAAPRH